MAISEGQTQPSEVFGWHEISPGSGWYTARQLPDFTTPSYARFAEQSRARWDLFEYAKTIWRQFREQRRRVPKTP
jgi:hypothetical protein